MVTIKYMQDDSLVFVQGIVATSNNLNTVVYAGNPPQDDFFQGWRIVTIYPDMTVPSI